MMDGLLPSVVVIDGVKHPDFNGFITVLGIRALRLAGRLPPPTMLNALEACRSEQGGFRFWPSSHHPHWAPELPDDADDTALMTLELFHSGRLSRDNARRIACLSLVRNRVRRIEGLGPVWRRVGVFKTWARDATKTDLIDCTANANVLALLATLDLLHLPGVMETCAMMESALDFAGDDASRAASLSPFYPNPAELVLALDHAVRCGARQVAGLAEQAAGSSWGHDATRRARDPDCAICCSPYGDTLWYAPELVKLRFDPSL